MLLASTREWLANRNTLKVLTKIQVSKSILQFATNCVIIVIWCIPLENKVTMKSHRTICVIFVVKKSNFVKVIVDTSVTVPGQIKVHSTGSSNLAFVYSVFRIKD